MGWISTATSGITVRYPKRCTHADCMYYQDKNCLNNKIKSKKCIGKNTHCYEWDLRLL